MRLQSSALGSGRTLAGRAGYYSILCAAVIGCADGTPPPDPVEIVTAGQRIESAAGAQGSDADKPSTAGARTVWVLMKEKAALDGAAAIQDWKEKGRSVYKTLNAKAASSQRSLRAFLETKSIPYTGFWIVNAIKLTADETIIEQIAARSDVARIVDDYSLAIPPPEEGTARALIEAIEWNIAEVRAPEVWDGFGTRGEEIVVASIDTGVQHDHSALVQQYRGTLEDGTFDHNYNWYDPSQVCGFPSDTPCDNIGHGTHTMGTIVGDDGGENQIGVAPGARWITAKGCEFDSCSLEALVASGQWMLAPTDLNDENPRPELRPHIVSNSWGGMPGDDFYREIVGAWIAAGIFPAFANGNNGPSCGTAGSPGDYPESYAVGAYDEFGEIAYFSSMGPSVYDVIKPNISAPGVSVRSSVPFDQYAYYSGTSMATPHIAGAVALLWSAAPAIVGDVETTKSLMNSAAVDQEDLSCGGDAENNNVWGEGKLDAYATLELAPIGPTGALVGSVIDTAGVPIADAKVRITGPIERNVHTGEDGAYRVTLSVGTYQLTVSAFGYLTETVADVEIEEDEIVTVNVVLESAPAYSVSGTVSDPELGPVAGAAVSIPGTPLPTLETDESGYFEFPSVPAGAYVLQVAAGGCYEVLTLPLTVDGDVALSLELTAVYDAYGYRCSRTGFDYIEGDTLLPVSGDDSSYNVSIPFPFVFYGTTYEAVNVTTNGYLTFEGMDSFSYYDNQPIPNPNLPNAAIYPLWDDLYVDYDSSIYTASLGEAPNRQFVIEWRNVYFLANFEEQTSFEVILNETGEVTIQYVSADTGFFSEGGSATIGIENAAGDVGLQYSYNSPSVSTGTALTFEVPFAGFVEGVVTNANDGNPVAGATITAVRVEDGRSITTRTLQDGFYRMQLAAGTYLLSATNANYETVETEITVMEDETVVRDFILATPEGVITPSTLQLVVEPDSVRTRSFVLTNEGTMDMTFEVRETGGGMSPAVTATANRERDPDANPDAFTTEGLYLDQGAIATVTPSIPGDIIDSFVPSGMGLAWGIGQVSNLWLSDVFEMQNVEFTTQGGRTGLAHQALWSGDWPGDAAYDSTRGLMCQVAVGGDNGIHCWDPETGTVEETIVGPGWSAISQRGLAYNATDDTFYIGGWNEGIIYHVAGLSHAEPGDVISSCRPQDGDISGLAYNDAAGVLWVATNSFTDTIYELNPEDCTVLSTFAPPQTGGYQGAGLEMDGEGNLWVVAQSPNTVYLMESGVPYFGDIPWLTVTPTEGVLAPGDATELVVTIDTTDLEPGLYLGTLSVVTNSGRDPYLRIPVSLVVSGYIQALNAAGGDYEDVDQEIWEHDRPYTRGAFGYVQWGKVKYTMHPISGTPDPLMYQSQRQNPYAYRYDDVPNGVYEINLRFAELQHVRYGQRLFDVIVEDTVVLPAHDIKYEVGKFAADDNTVFVEVLDNRLDVRFIPLTKAPPVINALRVVHRPDR